MARIVGPGADTILATIASFLHSYVDLNSFAHVSRQFRDAVQSQLFRHMQVYIDGGIWADDDLINVARFFKRSPSLALHVQELRVSTIKWTALYQCSFAQLLPVLRGLPNLQRIDLISITWGTSPAQATKQLLDDIGQPFLRLQKLNVVDVKLALGAVFELPAVLQQCPDMQLDLADVRYTIRDWSTLTHWYQTRIAPSDTIGYPTEAELMSLRDPDHPIQYPVVSIGCQLTDRRSPLRLRIASLVTHMALFPSLVRLVIGCRSMSIGTCFFSRCFDLPCSRKS